MDLFKQPPTPTRPTQPCSSEPGPREPLVAPGPPRDGLAASPPAPPVAAVGVVEGTPLRRVRGRSAQKPSGRSGVDTPDVVHQSREPKVPEKISTSVTRGTGDFARLCPVVSGLMSVNTTLTSSFSSSFS